MTPPSIAELKDRKQLCIENKIIRVQKHIALAYSECFEDTPHPPDWTARSALLCLFPGLCNTTRVGSISVRSHHGWSISIRPGLILLLHSPSLLPKSNSQSDPRILESGQRSQWAHISQSNTIFIRLGVYNQYDRGCQKENKQRGTDQNDHQYSHVVCIWFSYIYTDFSVKVNDLYHAVEVRFWLCEKARQISIVTVTWCHINSCEEYKSGQIRIFQVVQPFINLYSITITESIMYHSITNLDLFCPYLDTSHRLLCIQFNRFIHTNNPTLAMWFHASP